MVATVAFTELSGGNGCSLLSAAPAPDLAAAGYSDTEFAVHGFTVGRTADGPVQNAQFTTRIVARRPLDGTDFNGTTVVEWLNVSSGADGAPEYTYLAEELVRGGYAWVGVSAQYDGVEGGVGSVGLSHAGPKSLAGKDPDRYGQLHHPGDAYCYNIFELIGRQLRNTDTTAHPLAGLAVQRVLAVGESQSAMALTTFVTAFPDHTFDGFLIHSRAASQLPLGEVGTGIDVDATFSGNPVTIPDEVGSPVFIVQSETDVLTNFQFHRARQADTDRLRTWEVTGSAHADHFQIGQYEEYLGCPDPVNRGQQRFVLRAALSHLRIWVTDGTAPPHAAPLELADDQQTFVTDEVGNVRGGVRTPCVDVPTQILTGVVRNPVSRICLLFGATGAIEPGDLLARYGSQESYLDAYGAATANAIAEGFVLEADRAEVIADAHPELLGS
ncbi:alpha/beta hydrolase domain-containing protein [Gordonia sp. CPCC 205333]|uniref:alpha/beta hydrolase domain-containing protein n=1 Tax=Gordonia sp. CPCC 205333 TaxID=3140790 RepID=UPI003AF3810B